MLENALTISDLKRMARRRVPKMFFDYADSGAWTEETYRANESDFAKILLRQRVLVDMTDRNLAVRDDRRAGLDAGRARADRPLRHAARRRRDPRRPGGGGVRRALLPLHHVDLLDRGRGRQHEAAVLVPALRHARPRLHREPDRPGQGRGLLRPRADPRPADPRPAPQGPPERPLGPAEVDAEARLAARDAAVLVPRHARNQAARLRQHRRPRAECRRPLVARLLDQGAVRSAPVLEGRGVDQGEVGRQADPEGHPRPRGRPPVALPPEPTRSSSRTTAAASSTARARRSRRSPGSSTRSATGSRCTWTAASAPDRTC